MATKTPPHLPARKAPPLPPRDPRARLLDYPKCPIDRSRNEPGKPQAIYWNARQKCFICSHGHRFTGKE